MFISKSQELAVNETLDVKTIVKETIVFNTPVCYYLGDLGNYEIKDTKFFKPWCNNFCKLIQNLGLIFFNYLTLEREDISLCTLAKEYGIPLFWVSDTKLIDRGFLFTSLLNTSIEEETLKGLVWKNQ